MSIASGKRLDSIFIFPPGEGNAGNFFFYNTGSAYIISYLRQNGFTAEQFIYRELINLENCVRKILTYNAWIAGFTVFNTNFLTSVLIAEQIRKISPRTIIVFGGPSATNYSEFILNRYPFIDVCFRNESEETFLQFVSQLSDNSFDLKKTSLDKIRGISYKSENKVIVNPDSNVLAENSCYTDYLDKYSSPYLTGIIPGTDAFDIGLLTARGCNQNCVFCNCAVMSKRRFTTHSIDRVISELGYLSGFSKNNNILNLFDDAFSLISERAKRICREIINNKIKIQLSCITRLDCIDEELLDLMKEAGFISVGFSLESASPNTLRIIGKVHKAEDIPSDGMEKERLFIENLGKMSAYAKKIGIKSVYSSVMVGLPNETLEEANQTIETIDRNPDIDFYTHNLFNLYHGTPVFSTFHRYGYRIELADDNPIFTKTIYPNDIVRKVNVSSKAQYHSMQKAIDNNTVGVLSLSSVDAENNGWFNSIILFSDTLEKDFVEWLKTIFALNGTIIHIYSDRKALSINYGRNYETLIKHNTPSLNIRNYYLEADRSLLYLCPHSSLIRSEDERKSISICDFDFVKTNLTNSEIGFIKTLCKESDSADSSSSYEFFAEVKKEKNMFNYLINNKPFPYFANLCRWTKKMANCMKRNTLFVNDRAEVRLCWYGENIGTVGQSYDTIIRNFESHRSRVSEERKCNQCSAGDYCIKCPNPFPVSDEEYCMRQKARDLSEVAELFLSTDVFKQYM